MIRRIKSKKGDEEGTGVSKIVALVLLVILIVLIIAGVISGSLNPLATSIKNTWNSVLAFASTVFGNANSGGGAGTVFDCQILGKARTCEINYDEDWCKVDLGDNGTYSLNSARHLQRYYYAVTITAVVKGFITSGGNVVEVYLRYNPEISKWEWCSYWAGTSKHYKDESSYWKISPENSLVGSIQELINGMSGKNLQQGKDFLNSKKSSNLKIEESDIWIDVDSSYAGIKQDLNKACSDEGF